MMTSLLLVDVKGAVDNNSASGLRVMPTKLVAELTHTMHGLSRQIMVMNAYCDASVDSDTRTGFRDAGFAIIDTAGPDETLIMMSLDLASLAVGDAVFEEAILLGGQTDFTALARLARVNLMMVSVSDIGDIPASLEALADGLIDLDEVSEPWTATAPTLEAEPEPVSVEAPSTPEPDLSEDAAEHDGDGDPWPDPKTGPVFIAGTAGAVGTAVPQLVEQEAEQEAQQAQEAEPEPEPVLEELAGQETQQDGVQAAAEEQTLDEDDPFDELFADMGSVIAPSAPTVVPTEIIPSVAMGETADGPVLSAPFEPMVEPLAPIDPVGPAQTGEPEGGNAPEIAAVSPEAKPDSATDELNAEVDELLSRLMSDSLSSDTPSNAPALDVVPER